MKNVQHRSSSGSYSPAKRNEPQSVDIKTERREASSGAESRQREGKVAFVSNCLSVEASDLLAYQKYQLRISKPHCLIK